MPDLPSFLEPARDLVSRRLAATLPATAEQFAEIGPETEDLLDAARILVAGGKRLRAAFCVAGWRAANGAVPLGSDSPVIAAGAALELFQAAALAHDDVIDGSQTRRGLPAAHRRLAGIHRERRWTGPADRFGEAAAILIGDLLLAFAFREVAAAGRGVPPAHARRAAAVFDRMVAEVTLGQYLDLRAQAAPWTEDPSIALNRAERVIRSKSAGYSVELPIVLGAALAGGDDARLAACARFGRPVGEAFQLRDDVLGVFGDPARTGKPAGDDLREGKRTVLVALALERATPAQNALLRRALGCADLGALLDDARDVLRATGALAAVEARIDALAAAAADALESAGLDDHAVHDLAALARLAIDREA